MEFRQIDYFMKVAEKEHMTQAAEELHIAQPALSKTIKLLEEDVGLPLFERNKNRIHLNGAGKIFMDYARLVTDATKNVRQELEDYKQTEQATITIDEPLCFDLVYLAILKFNERYPSVQFHFNANRVDGLRPERQFDIEFYSTVNPVEEENACTLLQERIHMGVSHDHPLTGLQNARLTDFQEQTMVLTAPFHSTLNDAMLMHCKLAGFTPKLFVSASNRDELAFVLNHGAAVTFVPELTWYYMIRENRYALVKIEDPVCYRCVNLRWKNTGYVSKASVLFRDFLLEFVPQEVEKLRKTYGIED